MFITPLVLSQVKTEPRLAHALDEFVRDRPLAWIDDSMDESCHQWAERRPHPTLLVPTRSDEPR